MANLAIPRPLIITSKVVKTAPEAASKDVPVASVTSGSAGVADKTKGVLLRYNTDNREWDRITAVTPLNRSDRLLCLTPFRASITIGKVRMQLVVETEVRVLSSSSDAVPALEIVQGRLMIRQARVRFTQGRLREPVRNPGDDPRDHHRPGEARDADLRSVDLENPAAFRRLHPGGNRAGR